MISPGAMTKINPCKKGRIFVLCRPIKTFSRLLRKLKIIKIPETGGVIKVNS